MSEAQRLRVALGFPGSSMHYAAHLGLKNCTDGRHDVEELWSPLGAWDAFNDLWVQALNLSECGKADLFAMLHSDTDPEIHWLDRLIEEMQATNADCISVMSPIKDPRGLFDVAIADPDSPGVPLRRFTARELMRLPETVDAAALGYPGECLMQGDGCMVADLRKPVFHQVDASGQAQVCFNFPTQVLRGEDGKWTRRRESEDWYFSRRLWEAGGRSVATRKVRMQHFGQYGFLNWRAWGTYEDGDEESRVKWDHSGSVIHEHGYWVKDEAKYHKFDPGLAIGLVAFFESVASRQNDVIADFGCGLGAYVAALQSAGWNCHGYDGSPNTPALTGHRCKVADLAMPLKLGRWHNWALCLEVMEHIPPQFESIAIDNLAAHGSRGVILSWGGPNQGEGGHGHYNERPAGYVVRVMEKRGYRVDSLWTERLRGAAALPWFRENLTVFVR